MTGAGSVRDVAIIYVAGYGRSGSTILGTLLNSASHASHVGELCFLPDEWPDPERKCSCGSRFDDCPFWASVDPGQLLSEADWKRVRRLERATSLPRLVLGLISRRERSAIHAYMSSVLPALTRVAGESTIVDSSKTARGAAGRPLVLSRYSRKPVFLIHLIRDGRQCMRSLLVNGSNWQLEGRFGAARTGPIRASVGWAMANILASLHGRFFFRNRYFRMRFEDLLADPDGQIRELERRFGIDLSEVRTRIAESEALEIGHTLGGNRLRFKQGLRLRASQTGNEKQLPRSYRLVFALTAGWLNRMYGYKM